MATEADYGYPRKWCRWFGDVSAATVKVTEADNENRRMLWITAIEE